MKSVLAGSNQQKPLTHIILKAWALVKTLCVILLAQCLGAVHLQIRRRFSVYNVTLFLSNRADKSVFLVLLGQRGSLLRNDKANLQRFKPL